MSSDQDPEYVLGSTQREVERLQKQHAWVQTCLNQKIVFAPVDLDKPDLRVLDVGCTDGTLLRDLQPHVSPTAKLVGTDLIKEFLPESPQGNISYEVADVCKPPSEALTGAFDLTHLRFVLAAAAEGGVDNAVKNLADTLAPGGWLQVQEMDARRDTTQTKAWVDLITTLGGMFDKLGAGADHALKLAAYFEKAGLTNVTTEVVKLPAGKKAGSEKEAMDSLIPWKITIPTLRQAAQDLKMDLPEGTLDGLEERFEKEMLEEGAVFTSLIIYGQKPA